MQSRLVQLVVASLLAGANLSCSKEISTSATECTIIRIAERHIALHYPDFDSIKNPPVLEEVGSSWQVFYRLPEGTFGGTPEVVIDKRTLKVLRAHHTQ